MRVYQGKINLTISIYISNLFSSVSSANSILFCFCRYKFRQMDNCHQ